MTAPSLDAKLQRLFAMEDDWNGYGEKKPSRRAIATLSKLHFVPVSDGGVQLELHAGGAWVEICVDPTGRVEAVSWGPERSGGGPS